MKFTSLPATSAPVTADRGWRSAFVADFRNLLRVPDPAKGEVFGSRVSVDMKPALGKLAFAISARSPYFWDGAPLPGASLPHQNPGIPAGYAFLLQLIAHDFVDTRRNVRLTGGGLQHQNARTGRLQLDTVYGVTPEQSQHAYEADAAHRKHNGAVRRSHFRLGPKCPPEKRPADVAMCPFRDIARLIPGALVDQSAKGDEAVASEPCVADIRNDSSAMLSQLLVLFHQFHNTIFDCLAANAQKPAQTSDGAWTDTLFNCTREVVVTIYRGILFHDVLPRFLHPEIARAYVEHPDTLPFDPAKAVPIEFSLGASRFGHSIISNDYIFNGTVPIDTEPGISRSGRRRPKLLPLEKAWLADWARFFDVGAGALNLSRRIGPSYPGVFASFSFFPSAEDNSAGLIYRDMISGLGEGVWSVFPLIEALHDKYAQLNLLGVAALMKPYPSVWKERIESWLLTQPELDLGNKITAEEAKWLAEDPPLAFFIQFEAAIDPAGAGTSRKKGEHLGPLGSAIVAEAFYASLLSQPWTFDFRRNDFDGMIREICGAYLGAPAALADVFPSNPENMPALLAFLNKRGAFA